MGRGVDICKNPNFVEFYVLLELKVVTTQVMTLKVLVRHSDAAAGDGNESNVLEVTTMQVMVLKVITTKVMTKHVPHCVESDGGEGHGDEIHGVLSVRLSNLKSILKV